MTSLSVVASQELKKLETRAAETNPSQAARVQNLLTQVAYGQDANLARHARAALHDMITGAVRMFARAVSLRESRPMNTELVAYMTWGALMALGDRLAIDDRFSTQQALEAYLDFVLHETIRGPS